MLYFRIQPCTWHGHCLAWPGLASASTVPGRGPTSYGHKPQPQVNYRMNAWPWQVSQALLRFLQLQKRGSNVPDYEDWVTNIHGTGQAPLLPLSPLTIPYLLTFTFLPVLLQSHGDSPHSQGLSQSTGHRTRIRKEPYIQVYIRRDRKKYASVGPAMLKILEITFKTQDGICGTGSALENPGCLTVRTL